MHQKSLKYKPKPERLRTCSLPHHKAWTSNKPCHRFQSTGQCQLGSFCPYAHPRNYPAPAPLKKKYVPKTSVQLSTHQTNYGFRPEHEKTASSKRAIIQSEIRKF